MEHPHEPISAINDWQIWYRNNKVVAEIDEPLVTKDSRENMHDSSKAAPSVYAVPDWKSFWDKQPSTDMPSSDNSIYFNKAVEHFSDTLAEYSYELTGNEFYLAFLKAAEQTAEHAEAEYKKTKELVELLRGYDKK